VRQAGGLHVIGTEAMIATGGQPAALARRPPRGPGSTRFFLSLEDNLLRNLRGDRVGRSELNAFRVERTCPIEIGHAHPASLEGAQKKVETYYYHPQAGCSSTTKYEQPSGVPCNAERRRVLRAGS